MLEHLHAAAGTAGFSLVLLLALTFVRRLLLPRPLPGTILYHVASKNRLWGDLPDLLINISITANPSRYLLAQSEALQSPITQLWLKPFQKPVIVLNDAAETEHILKASSSDFDRGQYFRDIFSEQGPYHHIILPTNDQFRAQRKLIQDALSPRFFRAVSAPAIELAARELVLLWKTRAANFGAEESFEAHGDLVRAVYDAIWNIATLEKPDAIRRQLECDECLKTPGSTTSTIVKAAFPPPLAAILEMVRGIETISSSPFPRVHHRILKCFPKLKQAYALKDKLMKDTLMRATETAEEGEDKCPGSIAQLVVTTNEKLGSNGGEMMPVEVLADEVFGFVQAGLETSSTALAWAVKYLSAYQQVQARLRDRMLAAFGASTIPDAAALDMWNIPYLDAFIFETLRLGQPAPGVSRQAMVDTEILGHFVPKGTEVYMIFGGGGYLSPSFVSRTGHGHASKKSSSSACTWAAESMSAFEPERWLDPEKGTFKADAGPLHVFGLGIRGCWGRKIAMLEMRIFIAHFVLNFEFLPLPMEETDVACRMRLTLEPRQCHVRLKVLAAE